MSRSRVDRINSALYLPQDCRELVQSYLGPACWHQPFSRLVSALVNAGCPGERVGYLVHCYLESGRIEFDPASQQLLPFWVGDEGQGNS